jgi:superoxide dismutase, Fe-Mn family
MQMGTRRDFILKTVLAGVGVSLLGKKIATANPNGDPFDFNLDLNAPYTLPALPYAYDALEPFIDMQTMQIHHTKHHQAYVTNMNKALETVKDAPGNLDDLLKSVSKYSPAIRNNGGGHWNHSFFWMLMKPAATAGAANAPSGKLAEAINSSFESFEKFKEQFANAGKDRFGSGWAWLVLQKGKLVIGSTANQDNPVMDVSELKGAPILALDVWEHAYYLKYQNKRADYIASWWNVVNWDKASELFDKG